MIGWDNDQCSGAAYAFGTRHEAAVYCLWIVGKSGIG